MHATEHELQPEIGVKHGASIWRTVPAWMQPVFPALHRRSDDTGEAYLLLQCLMSLAAGLHGWRGRRLPLRQLETHLQLAPLLLQTAQSKWHRKPPQGKGDRERDESEETQPPLQRSSRNVGSHGTHCERTLELIAQSYSTGTIFWPNMLTFSSELAHCGVDTDAASPQHCISQMTIGGIPSRGRSRRVTYRASEVCDS